jgi:hypothetical protein
MKITQLAAKPQLVKITLDTPELVEEFGEAVDFWTWDRQPLDVFMKLASSNGTDNSGLVNVLRTLILDETGQQVERIVIADVNGDSVINISHYISLLIMNRYLSSYNPAFPNPQFLQGVLQPLNPIFSIIIFEPVI